MYALALVFHHPVPGSIAGSVLSYCDSVMTGTEIVLVDQSKSGSSLCFSAAPDTSIHHRLVRAPSAV